MKDRVVLWGKDGKDTNLLLAVKLNPDNNMVDLWMFRRDDLEDKFKEDIFKVWGEDGKKLEFPEKFTHMLKDPNVGEIIPEGVILQSPQKLKALKNQWQIIALKSLLFDSLKQEAEKLKKQLTELKAYDQKFWDDAKSFMDRIFTYGKDKDLSRKHVDEIVESMNEFFVQLKALRNAERDKLFEVSTEIQGIFKTKIETIVDKIGSNAKVNNLFNELKSIQKEIKESELIHKHRKSLWDQLDKGFQSLKGIQKEYKTSILDKRIGGLENVIKKMEQSIRRDQSFMENERRRMNHSKASQIEVQLRQAKIVGLEDQIRSKEAKLNDIFGTLETLKKQHKKAEGNKKPAAETPEQKEKIAATEKQKTAEKKEGGEKPEAEKPKEAIEKSEATKKPEEAEKPKTAEELKEAEKPEPTDKPKEATEKLEKAEKPETTEKSEATKKPEEVEKPEATEKPKEVENPEATEETEKTEESKAAEQPKDTADAAVIAKSALAALAPEAIKNVVSEEIPLSELGNESSQAKEESKESPKAKDEEE